MANLRIAELDFDQIKTNLKNFLQAQDEFSDYDFEGSGLSVLIDLLAYNTHYNAYLANMVVNEMFLDSAVKRSSAVSLAKHLGYVPRSARGARARLDVTVNSPTGSPPSLTLDKYSAFTSTINGIGYNFLTIKDYVTVPSNDVYLFSDVEVVEGQYLEYSFVVANPGPQEKFTIPNSAVDTTTITVSVQNSASDTTLTTYTLADDLSGLDGDSTVYFLEENPQEKYDVYFGDGILGKKLTVGNIVTVRYVITNDIDANVSSLITQSFTSSNAIGGSSNITIATLSNSTGGAAKENITSLKFYAPKFYSSQNRAVTKQDYETLIQQNLPKADSINVWGGEENDPPAYGRVFISIKPSSGFILTEDDKNFIINEILANKSILTVSPIFVDPEYLYVRPTVNVKFDPTKTTVSAAGVQSNILDSIENYFVNNLQRFNKKFYYSQFMEEIKNVNPAIVSIITGLEIQQRITPSLNSSNNFELRFANRIHPATLQSTRFFVSRAGLSVPARIKDVPDTNPSDYNGTGTIQLYNPLTGTKLGDLGTINYATGVLTISSLIPIGYPAGATDVRITAEIQEASYDVTTYKNQILLQDDSVPNTNVDRLAGVVVSVTGV